MAEFSGPGGFLKYFDQNIRGHRLSVLGTSDAQTQFLIQSLISNYLEKKQKPCTVVLILPGMRELQKWEELLQINLPELQKGGINFKKLVLPFLNYWGAERFSQHSQVSEQRVHCLSRWKIHSESRVILTTLQGLGMTTLPPNHWGKSCLNIHAKREHEFEVLLHELKNLGYYQTDTVDEKGTFAVRGGILDIYPPSEDDPVRIEFFGDFVNEIRSFNAKDQKSLMPMESVLIGMVHEADLPMSQRSQHAQILYEYLLDQGIDAHDRNGMVEAFQMGHLFPGFPVFNPLFRQSGYTGLDYIDNEDLVIFPENRLKCNENFRLAIGHYESDFIVDQKAKRPTLSPNLHMISAGDLVEKSDRIFQVVEFGNSNKSEGVLPLLMKSSQTKSGSIVLSTKVGVDLFDEWIKKIQSVVHQEQGSVVILVTNEDRIDRLGSLLEHRGFTYEIVPQILLKIQKREMSPGRVYIGIGYFSSHMWFEENAMMIIPEHAFYNQKHGLSKTPKVNHSGYISTFRDLKIGSLVVHVHHGVGRYLGMTHLEVGGIQAEFMILEYGGNDKLYVPIDKLNLIQNFSAQNEGGNHALDKLKSPSWEKRKNRVKKVVQDIAEKLLRIQAERKLAARPAYSLSNDIYYQFESSFPFVETEDQLKAIDDVNNDLCQSYPMDRLICGDVGFGKTEVALRATMRAVLEGSQVLVLTPTTVLCYQHFRTFSERLGKFGVSVEQVNRFVNARELKSNIERLNEGKLDVLIGTHRLLSKDIKPKRLGLIVIDEEQRFGVVHKETLKEFRGAIDVLTLTATPIPRSLHMATLGLKDISVIATPPRERLPIKTYVSPFDTHLIKTAIEHELARGGQVFFVHNRVEDIVEITNFINKMIPDARARFGHGQMEEHKLEQVIIDFIEQKFPVLVCTTIIESGVDMPNVNTLIVNQADRFGLAQLYQMRGRVGRSSRQSYAYFLLPENHKVTDEAWKRLEILSTHQDLGAGFHIASYDLELRGAGNLVGADQSGHVSDVGFDQYMELLDRAIKERMGKPIRESIDTEIKIPISAFIPHDYVKSENARLQIYKSLFSAKSLDEIDGIKIDLKDRFGSIPKTAINVIKVAQLKCHLSTIGAISLSIGKEGYCEIKLTELAEDSENLLKVALKNKGEWYRWTPDRRIFVNINEISLLGLEKNESMQERLLERLIKMVHPLAEALRD